MMTDRDRCHHCGSALALATTTFYRERGDRRWLFEHVPTYICERCGTRDFPYEAARAMERIMADGAAPNRTVQVGIHDVAALLDAVAAEPQPAT